MLERTKELEHRVEELIAGFPYFIDVFEKNVPFSKYGQYELHNKTISMCLELGRSEAAAHSSVFIGLLWNT